MRPGRVDFLAGMFSTWLATDRGHKDSKGDVKPDKEDRREGLVIAQATEKSWDETFYKPEQMTL